MQAVATPGTPLLLRCTGLQCRAAAAADVMTSRALPGHVVSPFPPTASDKAARSV